MSFFRQSCISVLLYLALQLHLTAALPNAHSRIHDSHKVNAAISEFIPSSKYGIADGIDLRILPLGASMVIGHGSSDSNSFRLKLREMLPGNRVTYIGSQEAGNMTNNKCECHSGFPIGPMIDVAQQSLRHKPNVILVIGGTNDLLNDMQVKQAPDVMGRLIDNLTTTLPEATLVVAKIPPFGNTFIDRKRPPFNERLDPVVEKRQRDGKRVLLVDPAVPVELISKKDQLHPNDIGYQMYADKFYTALVEAGLRGWIAPLEEQETLDTLGVKEMLSNEIKKGKEATRQLVKGSHTTVSFVMGLVLAAAAYWALMKLSASTRLRFRFGDRGILAS